MKNTYNTSNLGNGLYSAHAFLNDPYDCFRLTHYKAMLYCQYQQVLRLLSNVIYTGKTSKSRFINNLSTYKKRRKKMYKNILHIRR